MSSLEKARRALVGAFELPSWAVWPFASWGSNESPTHESVSLGGAAQSGNSAAAAATTNSAEAAPQIGVAIARPSRELASRYLQLAVLVAAFIAQIGLLSTAAAIAVIFDHRTLFGAVSKVPVWPSHKRPTAEPISMGIVVWLTASVGTSIVALILLVVL
jgi:hypothetical protein